jgi:hypothetical protein
VVLSWFSVFVGLRKYRLQGLERIGLYGKVSPERQILTWFGGFARRRLLPGSFEDIELIPSLLLAGALA